MPIFDPLPTLQYEGDFRISPDQGRQPPGNAHIKPTLCITDAHNTIHLLGVIYAFQGMLAQRHTNKVALCELIGRVTNGNRIRLGNAHNTLAPDHI